MDAKNSMYKTTDCLVEFYQNRPRGRHAVM